MALRFLPSPRPQSGSVFLTVIHCGAYDKKIMYFYLTLSEKWLWRRREEELDQYVSGGVECFWNWISTFLWVVLTLISGEDTSPMLPCLSHTMIILYSMNDNPRGELHFSLGPPCSNPHHYLANPKTEQKMSPCDHCTPLSCVCVPLISIPLAV